MKNLLKSGSVFLGALKFDLKMKTPDLFLYDIFVPGTGGEFFT